MKAYPSQSVIREALSYDPETGLFTRRKTGRTAGSRHPSGYIVLMVSGVQYYAHVLAWIYVHGARPQVVDHKDRNKANNRLANLRAATFSLNHANAAAKRTHALPKGVTLDKRRGRYFARIKVGDRQHWLGSFTTPEAAADAYAAACISHYGEFGRAA